MRNQVTPTRAQERLVNDHTTATGRAFYAGLLEALTQVMGSTKGYLLDHGCRVANVARQMGPPLGMDEDEVAELVFAAILLDAGMIGLAEDAWENPRPVLDPETRARVQRHPVRSESTVVRIPHLEGLAPLVRHHHEWWDGSGYPDGLSRDDIPLGAQVLRLADTVCALAEERPQRSARSAEEVLEVVRAGSGVEFGPEVAKTYLSLAEAGELAEYIPRVHQRTLRKAAERLLPDEVSPLSSDQFLNILAGLIDAKDRYTAGHSRRVAILGVATANQLGLGDRVSGTVWAAGYLHDLGKVAVPLSILGKRGPLEENEWSEVRSHVTRGAGILEDIPSLKHLAAGARYHHERWDGSGYPEGLSGERIPLVARILAVADAYDAMTSRRAYRRNRGHEEALDEVARSTGRHFGPQVSAAFLSLPDHLFQSVYHPRPAESEFFPPAPPSTGTGPSRHPGGRTHPSVL